MFRHKSLVFVAVVIVWLGSPTQAFFDGFEDGDYTSNPVWVIANPGYTAASVEPDPVRPGNLAVRIHGTDQAHGMLGTSVDVTYGGFDASTEYLATTNVASPTLQVTNGAVNMGLYYYDGGGAPTLQLSEYLVSDRYWYQVAGEEFSANTWYNIHMWQDVGDGQVHGEVRALSDNSLIAGLSFLPSTDLGAQSPISTLLIGAEETAWQYFDNVNMTSSLPTPIPAPGAAVLAMIGAGMVGWLRRRRSH